MNLTRSSSRQARMGVFALFGRWRARRHLNVVGVWLVFSCVGNVPNPSDSLLSSPTWEWPRIGLASWYSQQDPGVTPLTANGEPFIDSTFTAAMWDLPFDACVQVTNLRTLQRVVVRINDRGPHRRLVRQGRLIDLSRAAFAQVADLHEGLIPVQVELLDAAVCQVALPLEPVDTPTLSG